jgi:FkbM family methyltransferase
VNAVYVAENVLLAIREYKNWFPAIKAIATRRDFTTVTLRNGLQIQASHELKWLMNQIFYKKVYTPTPELQIAPNDIVMDIGANCGIFTMFAASLTKNTIYSFEPSPDNFRLLENNVTTNGLKNVVLCPVALDSEVRSAKFLLNNATHQENVLHYEHLDVEQLYPPKIDEYDEITVPTTTLERVMEEHHIERVDFLKMDCQGAEGPIFSSTPKNILLRINKIAMEYHDHISPLKHNDLQKILEEAGFTTLVKKGPSSSPLGFLYGWRER